ncbi:MAG: 6-phosphofructokinase [bacterium]|nr:6-phosphofructokinase [bacterium]
MSKNLLIAQGGGPTAVINSSLYGVIRQAQASGRVGSILGARHGILGVLHDDLIDLSTVDDKTVEGLKRTPGAALGSCRHKVQPEDYPRILEVLRNHDIGIFLYNGGNDSMDTAMQVHRLAQEQQLPLHAIGIPKTIDNDLPVTDRCPGFGSAARYVAQSVRDLGEDIRSLPTPVSIFETMGRNAGWLAASGALARRFPGDAPHRIYLPERPFHREPFLNDVQSTYDEHGWVVVVVSEGLKGPGGKPVYASAEAAQVDAFGHTLPGGVGSYLAGLVTGKLGLRCRSEKPGLCGRSSILLASPVDRQDAEAVGRAAVDAALSGRGGVMVTLAPRTAEGEAPVTGLVDLHEVANREKTIPGHWINAAGNDVTEAFVEYAKPLIGGDLPDYARLEAPSGGRQRT